MKRRLILAGVMTLAILAVSAAIAFADPPVSGAVFTTDSTCTGVNINIFASKDDVSLDGGPAHKDDATGLPNGEYYVQVTAPDGTLLGTSVDSSDATPVVVSGGEFAACYQLSAILIKASDGSAGYDDTSNPGGEYKVWVSNDSSFTNNSTKTDNFKVKPQEGGGEPPKATLQVDKFYDANANGVNDDGQLITGWKVRIKDNIDYIRYTHVKITVDPDDYTVTEFSPVETNWMRTTANPVQLTLADGDDKTVEFGNVCTGAGGGLTLGFWSNKNGETKMTQMGMAQQLAFLSGLNLIQNTVDKKGNPTGYTNFDPTAYKPQFQSWLLKADATNMAYMLSVQLAVMELNVRAGFVSGSALIYAPGTDSANALGFATVDAVMNEANAALAPTATKGGPFTVKASANRTYEENLKNALDKGNNNLNFVQSSACPFSFAQ